MCAATVPVTFKNASWFRARVIKWVEVEGKVARANYCSSTSWK